MAIEPIHFAPGNVDITLTPPAAPAEVGAALAANTAFPDSAFADGAIALGSIGAEASKDFKIKPGSRVSFLKSVKVGGSLFAGFGVYRSGEKLAADLKAQGLDSFDDPAVSGPLFPEDATKNLYALRWGYGLTGDAQGELPLGAGPKITFGASGRAAGLYAVVRSQDRAVGARDGVVRTLESWSLPGQVSADKLPDPGTWLVAENEGSLSLSLGLEYGYDFSWVRESLKLGGLSGDLGLKIEMGVKAQLGFSASGRYATVVSRESDRKELRLRVFRMRQHGWTFAFDAEVSGQVEQDIIPDNFDDFVRGVINVNGNQAIADIVEKFDKWTNPSNKLKDLLGAELVEYAKKMVKEVTGVDPETAFDQALAAIRKPIERWRALPHEVTSMLYGLLKREGAPLDELRDFLRRIEDETDPQKVAEAITGRLSDVKFFESPVGMWLTAALKQGILSALANIEDERAALVGLAKKTSALLDGSAVENTLKGLQKWIEERLGLDKILAVVNDLDFEQMDAWLKKRLSDFLGETVVVKKLEAVREAINRLRENAEKFYQKGFDALKEKYKAELHFSYSKTTTKTALLDLTFDMSGDVAGVGAHFSNALKGNFSHLLSQQTPGVKLNKGVLTHEMKRRAHIEVGLPYYSAFVTHINESKASGEAIDVAGDRLWVFTLESKDVVLRKHSVNQLTVSLQFTRKAGVRDFSGEQFRYNYQLRAVKRDATGGYLNAAYAEAATRYLPGVFGVFGKTFSTYLSETDKALDAAGVGGGDNFGHVLAGLDVSLPGQLFAAWKKAPTDKLHRNYMLMSMRVQNVLRRLIPACYFKDVERYRDEAAAYPLVVYSALPPLNRVRLSATGNLTLSEGEIYDWDFESDDVRRAVFDRFCEPKLRSEILPRIRKELENAPEIAKSYADSRIPNMRNFNNLLGSTAVAKSNFKSLARNEADLIVSIRKAALAFRESLGSNDLEKAIEKLNKFGSGLADAFNNKVGDGRYEEAAFRPLGAILFAEATYYLDVAATQSLPAVALLEFIYLKRETAFDMKTYLTGAQPPAADVALRHRIPSVGDVNA